LSNRTHTRPSFPSGEIVFIDDVLPAGAAMSGASRWEQSQKASGEFSLVAPYTGSGIYQTIIAGLAEPINAGEKLFAYARVADCAVPRQILVRARVAGQWVTAYWGEPVWGVTPDSINMGAVPASGSWQRLDVLLRDLGDGGDSIVTDLELVHIDGQVWFDRIGRMADCVAPAAGQPTVPGDEDVLIDDDAPAWITFESTSNAPLGWTSAQAASGALSLVHPYRGQGTSVTGIANLAQPLVAGSKLSLYVLVDSCSPPVRQIHLRITTSAGSGTVSWGEPVWDIDPSTLDRGPVPTSGSWTRFEVPLDALELDSGTLTRLDIAHVDGRIWFDRIALWPLTRAQLTSFVSDYESTVPVGTTVTWTATATGTVQPVQYRFERRDDLGNWSIVQPYGMQASYTWTPTAADIGTNAVRVSVRNGGSTADFEDTATLLVRVVEGGEGLWQHNPNVRFAWWKRWFEPRVPASLGVHYGAITTTSDSPARRHTLHTPELQLLAETDITTAATPAIAYEYIWFAGQPLTQIATTTGAIDWYFNDHLGTPLLQTDSAGDLAWRVEYDPYGTAFSIRTGIDKHQPLRFPGQEDEGGEELAYNIFRWYRAGWGRYTQADPVGAGLIFQSAFMDFSDATTQPFVYSGDNPITITDPLGLAKVKNESKGVFWYKPEECTTTPCPILTCPPGATCDADGLYPPNCKSNPHKIVNGCSGKVTAAGKLIVDCTFKGFVAKIIKGSGPVSDDFMKEHKDWAPPSDGPGCKKKIACK
jgi:RHS repeat-associated protein